MAAAAAAVAAANSLVSLFFVQNHPHRTISNLLTVNGQRQIFAFFTDKYFLVSNLKHVLKN